MFKRVLCTLSALSVLVVVGTSLAHARGLTIADRVAAQEAIERVYYSHQIGTTKPFEQAVSRAVLEEKVRKYLKQTVALEANWNTIVTAEMLEREVQRMVRQTRMPERLRQIFAALGNDAFLVQECLARAVLVDRLARNFFAYDERIHAEARREVERLREELLAGSIDPSSEHPRRTVVDLVSAEDEERARARNRLSDLSRSARVKLAPEEFAARRERLPNRLGEVGSLRENRDGFLVRVLLDEDPARLQVASFSVPKRTWDSWWAVAGGGFDEAGVRAADSSDAALPNVGVPGKTDEGDWSAPDGVPCLPDDTWDNGSLDDLPGPRRYHMAVWTGSEMVVWGGSPFEATGGRYDPATDSWTPTSVVGAPEGRIYHTAVWTGSEMIVWGGVGAGNSYLNTGGRYDPAMDSWTPTSMVDAPAGREYHTAVWTGSEMVVWGGGVFDGHIVRYLNDGARYDPAMDSWTRTSTVGAPSVRRAHTAVWTNTAMVVWGGEDGSDLDTGGRYDPATNSWTPTSTVDAPSPRTGHSVVWTGSEMVVWGGGNYSEYDTGGRYDPVTDGWTTVSSVNAPGRSGHTAIWTGTLMVVWGGTFGSWFGTGGRYDPETDSWTATSTTNAPSARFHNTAVWTGGLMIVWGGNCENCSDPTPSPFNTGGRYDPATDSWTPTSTAGAPPPRGSHTAIWTGNLMIVWGGQGGGSTLDTGGGYDPVTDSWSPTSTVNAPSKRGAHTALWTGNEMVVWGGTNAAGSDFDTGGRYDPAADTWTPTSTTNAPSERDHHTAVWTGNEMIVWGGGFPYTDTGGRYDPATDSWTPTSSIGAASPRSAHTAVWTGSLMVVWGGIEGEPGSHAVSNTGGRYDPAADSWAPTSTVGASPSARWRHTAVWTGSKMVVWGGRDEIYQQGNYLYTGGGYDPAADSWTPTSTLSAPAGRTSHTAVWTGSSMVVWGGQNAHGLELSGGRYDPATNGWSPVSMVDPPSGRRAHTAVWTGSLMVVWGGDRYGDLNTGGRYALGHSIDDDGDGVTECEGDCNDGNPATYPGAVELCDHLDNNCDGTIDEGYPTPGPISGLVFEGRSSISWGIEPIADRYDLVKGDLGVLSGGDFASSIEVCLQDDGADPSAFDDSTPAAGVGHYYLARGQRECKTGTYSTLLPGEQPGRDALIAGSNLSCP